MSLPASDESSPDEGDKSTPPHDDSRDWLVGPEEGLAAEMDRHKSGEPTQRPTLLRPGAGLPQPREPREAPPEPPRPKPKGAVTADLSSESDIVSGPGMMWTPGPSSVPSLRRDAAPAHRESPSARRGGPTREFPNDDAEERARQRAVDMADAAAEAAALGRPHVVVSPEAFEAPAPAIPWTTQVMEAIANDRRLQLLLGLVLVALVALMMWPRGERAMSIARLHQQAGNVDGASVLVAGRVDQVFNVGGGFAYYLIDRHDTLVVFTRGARPHERAHVTVRGTMSTGYLDGQPTLALFENP